MEIAADDGRLRYLYRRFIMMGKARISLASAQKLVGPDCAYHLYAHLSEGRIRNDGEVSGRGKKRNNFRKRSGG